MGYESFTKIVARTQGGNGVVEPSLSQRVVASQLDVLVDEWNVAVGDLDGRVEAIEESVPGIEAAVEIIEETISGWTGGFSVLTKEVTEGAALIPWFNGNAPYEFQILDVIVNCRHASTNGTVKLQDAEQAPNDITNAIICAVKSTNNHAATIDPAYNVVAEDGSLNIVCAGSTVANTQCVITLIVQPVNPS